MALQSSPSSSSSYGFDYDVFLSFRGSDTRFGFTGNLYHALHAKGIRTFIDDRELQAGEEITSALSKNIEDSKIAIIVFSKNYTSSSFCLDELVHIIECSKAKDRLVLPVFYDVEPSHLRHQTGSYGEAIAKHEERFQNNKEKYSHNMERLQKWKLALNRAANLSGYHFSPGKEYEYRFIGKIVDVVSNKINCTPLHVANYRVGLESRVLQVKSLLDVASDDGVYMVGIHGIGGIGKTTLAREIYNSITNQFEVLCFLDDVRQKTHQHGLVHLQETLLYETIREKDIKLGSVSKGISIIKQRLHTKKVLLILDDVDDLKQLQAMVGEPHWLGLGSRVIITTRDKQLLASHGIERTYEVEELNKDEALELLRWKAFKNNKVDSIYEDILNRVVTYASGLPLALEVVGSNLCGKHIGEWESTLAWYKRIPHKEIQKILKVSFDALEEDVQSVFLDIACCFNGYELEEVEGILCAHHGHCIKYHIGVLVEKSLIKLFRGFLVQLHDLIEDMGKEIVRRESPKEPGERSRLWFHKDIVQVLRENTELHEAGGTFFRLPGTERIPEWFEHQSREPSISFWFRNNIPSVALFSVSKSVAPAGLFIDGDEYDFFSEDEDSNLTIGHTYLGDLKLQEQDWGLESKLDEALLKNKWIHAEVRCSDSWIYLHDGEVEVRTSLLIESGIHVFKEKTNMEDIQFSNPYEQRKLDDDNDE